jgi:hypothetical protein
MYIRESFDVQGCIGVMVFATVCAILICVFCVLPILMVILS